MKTIMIIFLIGFLVFGAIGFFIRLSHDWNQLEVESNKLDEDSIAKRDGRAMQLFHSNKEKEFDAAQTKKKADKKFRLQLLFSLLSVTCLVGAIICGASLR